MKDAGKADKEAINPNKAKVAPIEKEGRNILLRKT